MSKTRKDWGFVKGQLDYLELENGWILFQFSNLQDITMVWNGRLWHVSGLNLVLRRWEPYFDTFSATIHIIDQWFKITRLPLELWEEETLKQLLKDVGHFIKVDDITLNRSKGKFARVCINIDITRPLRGSLFIPIPNQPSPLEVPISYEGLHEVCALCGSNAHNLNAYPETPKGPIEVIVEKFGATKLQNDSESCQKSASSSTHLTEKWVTVSPKKRGRSFPFPKRKSTSKLAAVPTSSLVKIVSNCSSPIYADGSSPKSGSPGILPNPPIAEGVEAHPFGPASQTDPSATTDVEAPPADPVVGAVGLSVNYQPLAPASNALVRHTPSSSHLYISSPASPLEGTDMEDEDVAMFLNFEPEDEVQLSLEGTKKRRLEVGDASSPSHSNS